MNENKNLSDKAKDKKIKSEDTKEEEEKIKEIESLRKAGRIAQNVKKFIKPKIKVGINVYSLIEQAESKIGELGGKCAFPVNVSINNIAAHYTSPIKDDGLVINEGDLVKIDLGVHVDGYIVDTAFTVNLDAAKMMIKPKIHTKEIGKKIESIVRGFKYTPIKELGGHQIERWIVHGKKQLPELGTQGGDIMNKHYKTLPFAERWLGKEFRMGILFGLQELVQQGKLRAHHVLAEQKGEFVAQSEETILVTENGFEQLT